MKFYVKYETAQEGPFDLITMVRKIRTGAVTGDLLVLEESDQNAIPASEHPQLAEFFREAEPATAKRNEAGAKASPQKLSFVSALTRGAKFLVANQFSAVFSAIAVAGSLVLAAVLSFALPGFMTPMAAIVSWVFFQFLLGILMFVFLRQHRGQMIDPSSLAPFIRRNSLPLLFCSALVGIFSAVGGLTLVAPGMISLILTIPGIMALALYSFAPLLILERNRDFWPAMETSRKTIMRQGPQLFMIAFGFAIINVLAGFFYVIPLAISLPLTYGALAEIYDEMEFQQ